MYSTVSERAQNYHDEWSDQAAETVLLHRRSCLLSQIVLRFTLFYAQVVSRKVLEYTVSALDLVKWIIKIQASHVKRGWCVHRSEQGAEKMNKYINCVGVSVFAQHASMEATELKLHENESER